MTFSLIITILLIFINGFFVAAEFAIVKVRSTQVDIKIKEGSANALRVKYIQEHLDRYLSAMQVGITLASLGLGWVGEEAIAHLIESGIHAVGFSLSDATVQSLAIPIAFIIITMAHIVIGEQLPKYIAIGNPLKTSLKTAQGLRWFYSLFAPFIWLLHILSNKVSQLVGVNPQLEGEAHNEEELRMMLLESEEEGYIKSNSRELIQNVFSFDDREVRHIYTRKTDMASIDITWESKDIMTYIVREGYSRYPIYEKDFDTMIGVLYIKDILQNLIQGNITNEAIRKVLRPYHIVPLTQSIESLLHDMQTMHTHIALVQSEFGDIVGMVTMEDIIEELIGDVQDETDNEQQLYTINEDGTRTVQGATPLTDLNEILPIPLPESQEYTTLGGYLMDVRGRIPMRGETIENDTYIFRIQGMRRHQIQGVHIQIR